MLDIRMDGPEGRISRRLGFNLDYRKVIRIHPDLAAIEKPLRGTPVFDIRT